jgi:hypothetical protein
MLCGVIRGPIVFRPELWELVPFAFGILARCPSMRLADVKDLLVNLIWKGAAHVRPIAGEIFAAAVQLCGEWECSDTCASFLEIVAAIGRCAPEMVEGVVVQGVAFLKSECADEVRNELAPFVEYVALQYPREVASDPEILAMLIEFGMKPGVVVAAMRLAPFLDPEIRRRVIEEARRCPDISSEETNGFPPEWYDRSTVTEQFMAFLEAYHIDLDETGVTGESC